VIKNPCTDLWSKRNTATVGVPMRRSILRRLARTDARMDRQGK
jgi:hypothetical protein